MDTRAAGSGRMADARERGPDLSLIDDLGSELWADRPSGAPGPGEGDVWPSLADELSETGRRLLWAALREAIDATPGDPDRALMIVEAFCRTMRDQREVGHGPRVAEAVG